MMYVLTAIMAFVLGCVVVFFLFEGRRRRADEAARQAGMLSARAAQMLKSAEESTGELRHKRQQLAEDRVAHEVRVLQERELATTALSSKHEALVAERAALDALRQQLAEDRVAHEVRVLQERELATTALSSKHEELAAERAAFDALVVSRKQIEDENASLRREVTAVWMKARKQQLDNRALVEKQSQLDTRSQELAGRYLGDVEKAVASAINAKNYTTCKQRLTKAIDWCREIGFNVDAARETELLDTLKKDFEEEVRRELAREEQAVVKAKMREEAKREKEIKREMEVIERERAVVEAALAKALADVSTAHGAEVESLKARLAEAESKARAIAQAQLTKVGHIYVISNLGAFGEGVYKIGMTRRLDPEERILELGDASVPFPFDVHMMISAENAPQLENDLHRHFHKQRVNKVNPRKEFFRVDLNEVRRFVTERRGEVKVMIEQPADEYRQSISMAQDDEAYIDSVFDSAAGALGLPESDE